MGYIAYISNPTAIPAMIYKIHLCCYGIDPTNDARSSVQEQ